MSAPKIKQLKKINQIHVVFELRKALQAGDAWAQYILQ